mgnify:CR=1 FL=1
MARSFLYFAYGSNLHPARLAARTPSCHALGRAVLARHVLRFHKRGRDGSAKCDAWFTGDPTDRLYGVVYRIARAERQHLEQAEDLGRGYDCGRVRVVMGQRTLTLLTFRARPQALAPDLCPFDWYLAYVVSGARQHSLPAGYVARLERTPSLRDPDPKRAALNWGLLRASAAPTPPPSPPRPPG